MHPTADEPDREAGLLVALASRKGLAVLCCALAAIACTGEGSAMDRNDELLQDRARAAKAGSLLVMSQELTDEELADLLADGRVPATQELNLHDNDLTAEAVEVIVSSPKAGSLRSLNLTTNPIGDEGVRALAEWERLDSIAMLYLSSTGTTDSGVRALAGSAHTSGLVHLDLGLNPVGNDGAVALAAMHPVDELFLEEAEVRTAGARALLEDGRFANLHLSGNDLGGLAGLGDLSPVIEVLSLARTGLEASDVQALAAAEAPSLSSLILDGNAMGDDGLRALAGASWLGELETLDAMATGGSAAGRAALVEAWGDRPGLTIER